MRRTWVTALLIASGAVLAAPSAAGAATSIELSGGEALGMDLIASRPV